ncbi:MAG: hypothetical protein Kow0074_22050 [Candidatus Zixiibacteriota bacterium]
MENTLQLGITIACLLIVIALDLNGYFGIFKSEMDRKARDGEVNTRIHMNEASRLDMENLTLASAKLTFGGMHCLKFAFKETSALLKSTTAQGSVSQTLHLSTSRLVSAC